MVSFLSTKSLKCYLNVLVTCPWWIVECVATHSLSGRTPRTIHNRSHIQKVHFIFLRTRWKEGTCGFSLTPPVLCGVSMFSFFFSFGKQFGGASLMVLYLMTIKSVTSQWFAHLTFLVAFTYSFNNILIIFAAMVSPSTQFYLPQTTFVSRAAYEFWENIIKVR